MVRPKDTLSKAMRRRKGTVIQSRLRKASLEVSLARYKLARIHIYEHNC
jgi:hypothetical protein